MSIRLVIASQKGGVGKSTLSMNLALALADCGYATVLVDTDPQSSINLHLGKGESQYIGLSQVAAGKAEVEEALVQTNHPNLRLLPKGRLSIGTIPGFEHQLYNHRIPEKVAQAECLKDAILLFDTPAGMGMITRAVLRAGTHVITPFRPDHLNLRSMNQIIETIVYLQDNENLDLQFLGFVLNMFDRTKPGHQRVVSQLWQDISLVFDTAIPYSDLFEEAQAESRPVFLQQKTPEARRFRQLADEILENIADREVNHEIRQLV
jgi:chromosome partitioning protein